MNLNKIVEGAEVYYFAIYIIFLQELYINVGIEYML